MAVTAIEDSFMRMSVYVQNRHSMSLSFNIEQANGNQKTVLIPKTYIPIDLSFYAKPEVIRESPDYRRLVARGWIKEIESKEAKELLSNPEAQLELNRLLSKRNMVMTDRNVSTVTTDSESSSAEDIAFAKISSVDEIEAVNEIKMMYGSISPSLKKRLIEHASEEGYTRLLSALEGE